MKAKLQNLILVPTDFSETCQHAIEYAAHLAKKLNFSIVLLHVITSQTRNRLKREKKGLETVIQQLNHIRKDIEKKYEIPVNYTAREGSIFDVIGDVASDMHANLMVLGTHGKKGLQYLFGSYAFKVVSQSPVPVVVTQQSSPLSSFQKVVFPVNNYIEPRQQVKHAIGLSRLMDLRILIFKQLATEVNEKNQLTIVTNQIKERFDAERVAYDVYNAEKTSQYEQQLIDFARNQRADAILMMTDSRIDHPDFNNSTWSEKLIFNEAAIPVVCINPVYLGEVYFMH